MTQEKKRPRIDKPEDEFTEGLLSDESLKALVKSYKDSKPYHHCVINPLVSKELLEKVRMELSNLEFTEKETDIYKVNQTGDLANMDKLDEKDIKKLDSLFQLKNAIYSQKFRTFVEGIVGFKGMSGTNIDLSINRYTQGCHLLNHDDVIGTRCVSFILYLPDPKEEWVSENGGKLELYPVKVKGTPENEPTVSLVPTSNTFALFAVQPGRSFHSVEEVCVDKTRISIQGWYHFAQPGEPEYIKQEIEDDAAKSTLEQLLDGEFQKFEEYKTEVVDQDLTEDEILYLAEFINPTYLMPTTIAQVNETFCEESQIQLTSFLEPELATKLDTILSNVDEKELSTGMTPHGTGAGNGWKCNGPPHLQRYLSAYQDDTSNESAKELLKLQKCFESDAYRKWISMVSSITPTARKSLVRRFRPGLDYTLALSNKKPVLHANLCLTKNNDLWESGEVGGYSCYMLPHSETQDAAVYAQSSEDDILSSTGAAWNQLMIVMREEDILQFVKYVSARAPGSRWDIDCEYLIKEL